MTAADYATASPLTDEKVLHFVLLSSGAWVLSGSIHVAATKRAGVVSSTRTSTSRCQPCGGPQSSRLRIGCYLRKSDGKGLTKSETDIGGVFAGNAIVQQPGAGVNGTVGICWLLTWSDEKAWLEVCMGVFCYVAMFIAPKPRNKKLCKSSC